MWPRSALAAARRLPWRSSACKQGTALSRLPVIVGIGGVNPAGRVSFHHAFRRIVIDAIGAAHADDTYASLAALMRLNDDPADPSTREYIRDNTLIRRISRFDPTDVTRHRQATISAAGKQGIRFVVAKRHLPERVPSDWRVEALDERRVTVCVTGDASVLFPERTTSRVTSAGQVPTGFEPGRLYPSRSHPRGMELALFGASDAVQSMGIDWSELRARARPDAFAVYAGSAMGQLDNNSNAGLMQLPLKGRRVTSKHVAFGLPDMVADFVSAYTVGNVGAIGGIIGACATFLYNLGRAVDEIRAGKLRVALVGGAEAPIVPEIIEGYRVMGALAEDEALMTMDGSDTVDNRRACRPFGNNCGFTVAEAAVYAVVCDDALALELGANIHCAAPAVYVNGDGFKKSISSPGVGNYLTMARAMSMARAILGDDSLRRRTFVHAHGTGTPQNRVTESRILDQLAGVFGIEHWPVAAVKSVLGHSMAPASGDQLACALGTWAYDRVPGITTIDALADDVSREHLRFETRHFELPGSEIDAVFVNSKGFGGNNATGLFLAPDVTRRMLATKHGERALTAYDDRNAAVHERALAYDAAMTRGDVEVLYGYGEGVIDGDDLAISERELRVPGYARPISLDAENPFPDMTG